LSNFRYNSSIDQNFIKPSATLFGNLKEIPNHQPIVMQESLYTLRFANASIYTFQDFGKRIKESTVGLCHLVASQHGVLNFFARESCSATNSVVDSTLKRVGIEHQSRYGYNSWSIRRKSESRCRMQFLSGFHKIHFTTGIERFTRLRVHLGNRSNISFLS
jgi:hypothetical protein